MTPTAPPGYTAEELERDNPYNQWMQEGQQPTKWYALNNNGDMVYVGEFEDFDDASNHADSLPSGCVWLVEEPAARDWLAQLKEMLK